MHLLYRCLCIPNVTLMMEEGWQATSVCDLSCREAVVVIESIRQDSTSHLRKKDRSRECSSLLAALVSCQSCKKQKKSEGGISIYSVRVVGCVP